MSSSFLRIFQQAEKTFSAVNAESYKANCQHLKKLVDKLVLSDLNVNLPTEKFHDQEVIFLSFNLSLPSIRTIQKNGWIEKSDIREIFKVDTFWLLYPIKITFLMSTIPNVNFNCTKISSNSKFMEQQIKNLTDFIYFKNESITSSFLILRKISIAYIYSI